jgi:hydrogenase maturation protease
MAVVGVGNADRGDDGAGIAVARAVAAVRSDVDVLEQTSGDPAALLDALAPYRRVVIVDATVSEAEPGTVRLVPLAEAAGVLARTASSHGLGLATALALGRELHALPDELMLIGIEADAFDHGSGLSPAVAAAVPRAAQAVAAALDERRSAASR